MTYPHVTVRERETVRDSEREREKERNELMPLELLLFVRLSAFP